MSAVLTLFLIVLLVFFLIIGLPIAVSLGLCAVFGAVFSNIPLSNLVKPMANSLISSPMISIPFFLLVGNIMFESGISKRLIEFLNSFLGSLRGGLNYAAVFACALFSALAGPAPITVIAVGSILYAEMSALGYSQARSAGLFTAAGSLGSIIPPSVIMVVYASITKAPLKDLFVSGAGIGVMIAIVFLIICFYLGRSEFAPKRVLPFSFATFAKTFFAALPAVFIPIIIVGGIYFKLLSALQSGVIASVYALILAVCVYRSFSMDNFVRAFFNSAKSSATILFIIISASTFSAVFMGSQAPKILENIVLYLNLSPLTFSFLSATIVIILGTVLDGAAICVLLAPALLTIAQTLGLGVVHFAMIMCIGAVLGSMTPPMAVSIFAAQTFSKLPIGSIVKGQAPFFVGFLAVYMLIVVFPFFSEFLLK